MTDAAQTGALLVAMREAYLRGENAMEAARKFATAPVHMPNDISATTIAYDLQAGSYIRSFEKNSAPSRGISREIANRLEELLPYDGSLLEVGVGEATTLASVLSMIKDKSKVSALGFDLSWSRVAHGNRWLRKNGLSARLFVADLLRIPLESESVDVVYTCHSLEPNRGLERDAISECLRVARGFVVLVEPIYELASNEAKLRMDQHGYVRGLRSEAEALGAEVVEFGLLPNPVNPLNPTGVIVLRKGAVKTTASNIPAWCCPLTGTVLKELDDELFAESVGIAYPQLRGVPLLRREHAVVASHLESLGRL